MESALRQFLRILLAVIVAVSFTGSAVAGDPSASVKPDIRAEAPTFTVGDQWDFESDHNYSYRVVGIEDGSTVFVVTPNQVCPECRFYDDSNLVTRKLLWKSGKDISSKLRPRLKFLDFPLFVGKEWEDNKALWSGGLHGYYTYLNTFRVTAFEKVKTPAGEFDAFRIEWRQRSPEEAGRIPFEGVCVYWYAPSVKFFVKRVIESSTATKWVNEYALVRYKIAEYR